MSPLNPIYDLMFDNTPKPRTRRTRRTNSNRRSTDRHIVIKLKGRLKHYRINRYGDVIEEE